MLFVDKFKLINMKRRIKFPEHYKFPKTRRTDFTREEKLLFVL